jgi:hypothetical protein
MTKFRISFGTSACIKNKSNDVLAKEVCKEVLEKISQIKALNFEQVGRLPSEEMEIKNIKGKEVAYSTYKQDLGNGVLIVVQAFIPTLIFPNYISFNGVGKIYAEGIIFSQEGNKNMAEDNMLFSYR